MRTGLCAGMALALVLAAASASAQQAGGAAVPVSDPPPAQDAATTAEGSGPLSWHGITLYGTLDVGLGWVSHGLPENGYNYEGESLINRNGNHSQFLIAPNNLSQTGLGVRGKEEFAPGWFGVFNASTGINPQSGELANLAATNTSNAGLPRSTYSFAGDGARAGQAFNDELFAGISSPVFGMLTFGRQRALGTDAALAYDPANGAYSFSFIGYNGQGGCYSDSAAWTAATCMPESPHNTAYGFDVGGTYNGFSGDIVLQHFNQAISVVNPLLGPASLTASYQSTVDSVNTNPINGANLIGTDNTEYGIVTDNTAIMLAAKYTWDQLKFYAGFEHILQKNPTDPLGVGATAQGGYLLSGVEDDNLDSDKVVKVYWAGVKYAVDSKTDVTLSYYRVTQNDFRVPPECSATAGYRSSCAGALDEVSLYTDYHFTKRFDGYAGIAYSDVSGGLAISIPHKPGVPYFYNNNIAPTIGVRYAF